MATLGDWHIDHLTLENFRCFEHLEIDFDPSLTVLVGVNGSGKTAVLDAISIALEPLLPSFSSSSEDIFKPEDARRIPKSLLSRGSVAEMIPIVHVSVSSMGKVAGKKQTWARGLLMAGGLHSLESHTANPSELFEWPSSNADFQASSSLPVISAYGVDRLSERGESKESGLPYRLSAYDAALNGTSDFTRISQFVKGLRASLLQAQQRDETTNAAGSQFSAIRKACDLVLEGTGWKSLDWDFLIDQLVLTHPRHGTLPINFLSSGIRITVGMVIDIASRIARANPHLGGTELLEDTPGIVLIDEVDLHLHPQWQQRIIPALTKTFPKVQFIVTTHSPQVLSTVPAESIRILNEDGTVGKVDYSEGLRSDIVLRKILSTDPEPDLEINRKLDKYMRLVDAGEGLSEEAKLLRRELNDHFGGVTNAPELATADASMVFYDLDGL